MFTIDQHLDNLIRHINLVREACILLGKKLIATGEPVLGKLVIARGFCHDVSKFYGIEWDYLHCGPDVEKSNLDMAMKHHVFANKHHPEYWGGFDRMNELAIAELACDWLARSQEFGTSLRDWIEDTAIKKFNIDVDGKNYAILNKFLGLLLEDSFVK